MKSRFAFKNVLMMISFMKRPCQ